MHRLRSLSLLGAAAVVALGAIRAMHRSEHASQALMPRVGAVTVNRAVMHDRSERLVPEHTTVGRAARGQHVPPYALAPDDDSDAERDTTVLPVMETPAGSAAIEQTSQGTRPPAAIVASFDGLGAGFEGPQGTANVRNPSDNSLAVGPNHIVQIVNSRMAIYTKKGGMYDTTGRVLYGPSEPTTSSVALAVRARRNRTVTPSCVTISSRTAGSS